MVNEELINKLIKDHDVIKELISALKIQRDLIVNEQLFIIDLQIQEEETNLEIIKEKIFKELKIQAKMFSRKALLKFRNIPLEIDDLVTESWLALCEALRKFDSKISKRGFIKYYLEMVYWRSMDYIRKFLTNRHKTINLALTKPIKTWDSDNDFALVDMSADDPWKFREVVNCIQEYIDAANEQDRKTLKGFLEGDSIENMADEMVCSPRTMKRRLKTVLHNLKSKLA
ncbi:hypothetical protein SSABA_v1c00330 [Spiroplasma sabaudiense Ar-1343]|uniref:RNA polymerase sigma-70 region 2 domain-containing protein n=1 Tax=Spiroplasma sabaudiense Ar-1343 TaxID=1276257 RepID=W6A978_9MOLU|nr:sigma-70 family RNA polymerase sigma factor [Spiroplasma sabaudiense]AHI53445.1 hypothetical protein SSABA_v1c00330 [Spiroplasma sabaudiense Ar-1343]